MAEYQMKSTNNDKEQQHERRVQKVVSGKVKTKKNEFRSLLNMFISEDAANVKGYIVKDVIIPTIKKTLYDVVTDSLDMVLNGGTGSRKTKSGNKVSYRNYYDDRRHETSDYRVSGRFSYDDIVFSSRSDAENARSQMLDLIDTYGFVTVADMYDMADLPFPYTSAKYGWTNISTAETVRVRDGFILKLPKAMPIE